MIGVFWLCVVIYKSGKFQKIKDDFQSPMFWATIGVAYMLMFMTKDSNPIRSREVNRHAFMVAIAAYFGNLNIWFAAFLLAGTLVYYTWDSTKEFRNKMGK